ncbi:rho guanine nucleotide exchange factor 7 isoform X2 [Phymastichus coffea]|uniref:rho guanine nucleotide exchange factor 7 isoform X2 n=1 Tax=Phymastichus coffea TaxID=108790 RepID=UPI00273CCDDC|nr:rho guanine nucleotide exchange factor 7 isoform X2 [Phymastichus coffea]
MSKSDGPKVVTALFSFKGKNNDELCFKKGDIITITQLDDGGWWEGTLNEKTGWFPSNYVKELKAPGTPLRFSLSESDSASTISAKLSPEKSSPDSPIHQTMNRDIVLKNIVDSERANVAELQGLVNNFLQPLETANILKKEEYKQLIGNIHEVLEAHQRLLVNLDSVLPQGPEARVGNIFLTSAPKLKSIHTSYCNCHPQAVCILDRYRDELNEFMERSGAITPGILVLTTGLSKPFRRLDKYSAMLQELERHTEKNHSDRGDTQRSVSVYREIADRCAAIRKQRELALQILTCGIKGWEGEELSVLGDIIHVGAVILVSGVDRRDRYFVLFPATLLVLSTSPRMSSFVYEGKLPLTGINIVAVEPSDDIKNAFEISGPMIESITVLCPSREERQHWIELLSQDEVTSRGASLATRSPTTSISHLISQNSKLQAAGAEHSSPQGIKTPWRVASLRPAPPIYALKALGKIETDGCRLTKIGNERQFEEDAAILRVIEGYCLSANARFTVHSGTSRTLLKP